MSPISYILNSVWQVSCSTWLSLWILLNEDDKTWEDNLNPHAHTYGLLRRKPSASEMYYKITTYTKFILVRHPFERLLSAYRAKFESPVNKPAVIYRRTYGVNIAAKYRTEPVNSTLLGFITFKELVAYILDKYPRKNDRHWERYSRLCNPCAIEYDIIGKYETLKLDSDHFLDRIGAKPELRYPNEKKTNTSGLVNSYLETLTNKQIDGLLKLYKNDFNLFGYKKARRIE
ncbi:hypothetical protein SK128_026569 [Halocaridina rubra]|uniref:Carbohydrate sulfotransferase n=1 Tax=Halocaridina rubra TaxID=373956 RepID=A0AAN8X156_HALRR